MTISDTSVLAGWYADPAGSHSLRWWDGTQWTNHLRMPEPVAAPAVLVPAVPVPVVAAPVLAAPIAPTPIEEPGPEPVLSAYRPGSGFGGEQTSWSNDSVNNRGRAFSPSIGGGRAALSIFVSLVAIAAYYFQNYVPYSIFALPAVAIIALFVSLRALTIYLRNRKAMVWAPALALVLALATGAAVILGYVDPNVHFVPVLARADGLDMVPQIHTQGPAVHDAPIEPGGKVSLYEIGQGAPIYLPKANADFTKVVQAEAALVKSIEADYTGGASGPGSDGHWPTMLSHDADGYVVSSDGHSFGQALQPGWEMAYTLEPNGSFLLGFIGADRSELVAYSSQADVYALECMASDTSCVTASPVPPKTETLPATNGTT